MGKDLTEAELRAKLDGLRGRAETLVAIAMQQTAECVRREADGDPALTGVAMLIMLRVQSAALEAMTAEVMSNIPERIRAWLEPNLEKYTLRRYREAEGFIAEAKAQLEGRRGEAPR